MDTTEGIASLEITTKGLSPLGRMRGVVLEGVEGGEEVFSRSDGDVSSALIGEGSSSWVARSSHIANDRRQATIKIGRMDLFSFIL